MSVATADPVRSDVPFDLRRGSLRLLTTAANAVGIQAPVAGVSFLPALMAGIVGTAGPLSFAVATVAMLFVAYAFVTFTRAFNSAGSVYAFNGRALGRAVGFVSVWLLVAVYLSYAASVYASNANALRALLALGESGSAGGGIPIVAFLTAHWIVLAVGCWALTIAIAHRSVRTASTVILACEGVALILVAAVAAAVVLHGGYHHHGLSKVPLVPGAPGLAVLGLGVVFAFTGFSGFEVAATLGEEARLPVRVVPASMVAALLLSGGVYTVMAWVEAGAFSSPAAFAASAAHGVPLVLIAQRFAGPPLAILVLVAAIISGFGAQLACINGATRLLYALGRDRVAPHRLAMVGARYGTPTKALAVV
ncbi:MAG TPA: APC family permease, partial [Candidatus Saccharimonadales bacterium]|nr:APC family permease [Candidatus Saccharimonadales bacterium]